MVGFVGVPIPGAEVDSVFVLPLSHLMALDTGLAPARCRAGSGITLVKPWPVVSEVDTSCNTERRSSRNSSIF